VHRDRRGQWRGNIIRQVHDCRTSPDAAGHERGFTAAEGRRDSVFDNSGFNCAVSGAGPVGAVIQYPVLHRVSPISHAPVGPPPVPFDDRGVQAAPRTAVESQLRRRHSMRYRLLGRRRDLSTQEIARPVATSFQARAAIPGKQYGWTWVGAWLRGTRTPKPSSRNIDRVLAIGVGYARSPLPILDPSPKRIR